MLTTGFKSGSLGGDPLKDFNGLLFHDEPGKETVYLHGEKQTLQSDEGNKEVRVGRYQRTIVGGPFFSIPGSGSGGGHDGISLDNFGSTWGNIVQYAYGHALLNCAGLTVNSTFGAYIAATCNPLALGDIAGDGLMSTRFAENYLRQAVSGIRDVAGGFCSYTLGASTLLNFGPSLLTGHGWGSKTSAPSTSLLTLAPLDFGISARACVGAVPRFGIRA